MNRIISRFLEKDRELRYQTASDLRADLRRLERDATSGQSAVATTTETGRPSSSAEYLVSELKQHKRAAYVTLTILVLITRSQ